MKNSLSPEQIKTYQDQGFLSGLSAFSSQDAAQLRQAVEALERDQNEGADGFDLSQFFRVNGHLVIPLLSNAARTPKILDQVVASQDERLFEHINKDFALKSGTDLPSPEGVFPRLQTAEEKVA